jgi:hypothetical protein
MLDMSLYSYHFKSYTYVALHGERDISKVTEVGGFSGWVIVRIPVSERRRHEGAGEGNITTEGMARALGFLALKLEGGNSSSNRGSC